MPWFIRTQMFTVWHWQSSTCSAFTNLTSCAPFLKSMLVQDPAMRRSPIELVSEDPMKGKTDQDVIDEFCAAFDALATLISAQSEQLLSSGTPFSSKAPQLLQSYEDVRVHKLELSRLRRSSLVLSTDPLTAANFRCRSNQGSFVPTLSFDHLIDLNRRF